MSSQERYDVPKTLSTLEFLGFNVRDSTGATTVFCIHKITKDEIWIPKDGDGFLADTLSVLFEPVKLRFDYFKFIYHNGPHLQQIPSDQQ